MKVSQLIAKLQEIHDKSWLDMDVIVDDEHESVYKEITSLEAQQLGDGDKDLVITIL